MRNLNLIVLGAIVVATCGVAGTARVFLRR